MALTIQGATVGYDDSGVQQLLDNIRAKVIEEAANKMESSLDTLNTSIDDIWVGHSAEIFKENMATDVSKIKEALHKTYEVLCSEIKQIVNAMSQVDQELVQKR